MAHSDQRSQRVDADTLRSIAMSKGFNAWLGPEILLAEDGEVRLALTIKETLKQHHGFAHGGILMSLADTAATWAAATRFGDVVTTNISFSIMRPGKGETLFAKAIVLSHVGRNVVAQSEITSDTGDVVAHALVGIRTVDKSI